MINRRQFLKVAAATGAALAVPWYFDTGTAFAFYQSTGLQKFAQPLRGVGPGGIPVAAPDAFTAPVTGVTHYSLSIGQFRTSCTPASARPPSGATTRPWRWAEEPCHQKHLGGIIVAQRGTPIQLTFTNDLPTQAHPAGRHQRQLPRRASKRPERRHHPPARRVRALDQRRRPVHLVHPGRAVWPEYSTVAGNFYKLLNPDLQAGPGRVLLPQRPERPDGVVPRPRPRHHPAQRLRGHRHAYIIRDNFEANLRNKGLPDFVENGGREIPIVIQDKIFVGPDILSNDPTWPGPTDAGQPVVPAHLRETAGELGDQPSGLRCPTPRASPRCSATRCSPTAPFSRGDGRGPTLPPAHPQRLPGPLPEPAALRGRRQPGRHHPQPPHVQRPPTQGAQTSW